MVNIPAVLLLTGLTLVSSVQLKSDFKMSEEDYYRMSALRPLAVEFTEYFANISEINFQSNTSQLAGPEDLQCLAEMDQLMKGFAARNMWALKSKYYTDLSAFNHLIRILLSVRLVGYLSQGHTLWKHERYGQL